MGQEQKQKTEHFSAGDIMHELMDNTSYALMVLKGAKRALCESKVGELFKGKIPKAVKMHALMKAMTELSEVDPDNQINRDKLYKGITALAVWSLETIDFKNIFGLKEGRNADSH